MACSSGISHLNNHSVPATTRARRSGLYWVLRDFADRSSRNRLSTVAWNTAYEIAGRARAKGVTVPVLKWRLLLAPSPRRPSSRLIGTSNGSLRVGD